MSDFNIKEIDFYSLDLEKYIDWLLKKYELFSTVWEVAYFDEFIDDLHRRKYFAGSHYLMTRTKKLPENIEKAYNNKISHFEAQKNKYNGLIVELYRFKSVGIKKIENNSKYIFLTSEQLKNVKIDVSWLAFWMNEHKESYYVDLIDEIDTRKLSTPLNDVVFYQKEKDKIINDFDFDYLPIIMNGGFIFDLDNDSNALSFSTEIDKIRILIYLSEKIQGNNQKHPLTKPIKWNKNINALGTIFYALSDAKIIDTTNENIKRLLMNCFTDNENKDLSKHYLDEIFKPSKGKLNKEVLKEIEPLIRVLNKNSPQQ